MIFKTFIICYIISKNTEHQQEIFVSKEKCRKIVLTLLKISSVEFYGHLVQLLRYNRKIRSQIFLQEEKQHTLLSKDRILIKT